MKKLSTLTKALITSALDCYVLPGTSAGTIILYLYMRQWQKQISAVTLALVSLLFFQLSISENAEPITEQVAGSRKQKATLE